MIDTIGQWYITNILLNVTLIGWGIVITAAIIVAYFIVLILVELRRK